MEQMDIAEPAARGKSFRDRIEHGDSFPAAYHHHTSSTGARHERHHSPEASLLHNASDPSTTPRTSPGFAFGFAFGFPPPYSPHHRPSPPPSSRRKSSWWRWPSSWNMYVFFAFGVACAAGHHVFYDALDGQVADSQLQMLRYGTVLAFAAKAGLSAAVVAAFRQRAWTTVRTRFMSVAALDSLFAATEDLVALVNWEFFGQAKTAAGLAAFVWLSPLVVILTANTLLVEPRTVLDPTTCPGIRTLNFTLEETSNWRQPVTIGDLREIPLSFWNTTKPDNEGPPGWFDYYTGPSPRLAQSSTLSAFLNQVVGRQNASMDTCGSGWNCTFEINFIAPGYKCEERASGIGSRPTNLTQESGSAAAPFGTDILLPKGPFAYYAFASGGEYSMTQMDNLGPHGIPNSAPPYPKHLGALRTEPLIWIGYVVPTKPGLRQPNNASDPNWGTAFTPKIFACEHHETSYTAHFNFSDGTQTARVTNRTFLGPIINTTFVSGVDADDGTADNTTATPEENYILPTDVARYRKTAAYHSLGSMLRFFINGTIEVDKSLVTPIADTGALQTKLLDPRSNYFPFPNLMDRVQDLYEDMILSLLSNPQFAAVVWAARPAEQSGALRGAEPGLGDAYRYNCTRTRTANMYSYHARDLWIVYGIAVLVTLMSVAAGTVALRDNGGITRNARFSSLVAATRGPALEKVRWEGPEVDRGSVPRDVKRLKLGYGRLTGGGELDRESGYSRDGSETELGRKSGSVVRYGFGLEGDVHQRARKRGMFHA